LAEVMRERSSTTGWDAWTRNVQEMLHDKP
jgi:hypothetical protein